MPALIPPHNSKRGFTLLEVLISLLVLTLGVFGIFYAFSAGLLTTTEVEGMDLALNIGQAKMEQIKDIAYAGIVSSASTPDPNFPNFSVAVASTAGDPKQVDVTVAWNVKGGQTSLVLTTLVANY